MNPIKHFTYHPIISKIVWRLHLAKIFRKVYYWLNRPSRGVISVEIKGANANFYIHTPWELRSLEASGDFGHERHILEPIISMVHSGDVVYDIGSNFGIYTIMFAKVVGLNGVVIAIEPEIQSYEHLQDNLKLNALTNVRSFHLALGDRSGEAKLFLGQVTGASSLMKPWGKGRNYQVVKVIEGDRLVKMEHLPLPRIVKIDVEGAEYAVIRGLHHTLARPACELVCCEIHPQLLPEGVKSEQILGLLRFFGFNRIKTYRRGTSEYHIIAQKESP